MFANFSDGENRKHIVTGFPVTHRHQPLLATLGTRRWCKTSPPAGLGGFEFRRRRIEGRVGEKKSACGHVFSFAAKWTEKIESYAEWTTSKSVKTQATATRFGIVRDSA
jgi:hypothetical protein